MDDKTFPDGSAIGDFFSTPVAAPDLSRTYKLTDYQVRSDAPELLQTAAIQAVIDLAASNGGGTVVVPPGTYRTSALFFKPGTRLHLEKHATLLASDDISDYPLVPTRIEGQCRNYFPAVVNADGVDHFAITGSGVLDGNGARAWRSFWLRKLFDPLATNLSEMRARLLFVANSDDVEISGVTLRNSQFWTSHYYRCRRLKIWNVTIYAPGDNTPTPSPSTDGIDLDNCTDVLIHGCDISNNDDAITFKGGKGSHADRMPENGPNCNVVIENCHFGYTHTVLTCGSETVCNRNVIFRNSAVDDAVRLFYLKARQDTPQLNEYFRLTGITGRCRMMFNSRDWTKIAVVALKDKVSEAEPTPPTILRHVTFENLELDCDAPVKLPASDAYEISDVAVVNCKLTAKEPLVIGCYDGKNFTFTNVQINGVPAQPAPGGSN